MHHHTDISPSTILVGKWIRLIRLVVVVVGGGGGCHCCFPWLCLFDFDKLFGSHWNPLHLNQLSTRGWTFEGDEAKTP